MQFLNNLNDFNEMIIPAFILIIAGVLFYILLRWTKDQNYIDIRTVLIDDQFLQYNSNKVKGVTYIYDKYTSDIYITVKDKNKKIITSGKIEDDIFLENGEVSLIFDTTTINIIKNEHRDFIRMLYLKFNIS